MGIRQEPPTSVVFHCAFAVSDCERSAFAGHPAQSLCAQPRALDPSPGAILTQILPVAGQLAWPNVEVEVESIVCMFWLSVGWINSRVPSDWQENNLKICKLEGGNSRKWDMGWRGRGVRVG